MNWLDPDEVKEWLADKEPGWEMARHEYQFMREKAWEQFGLVVAALDDKWEHQPEGREKCAYCRSGDVVAVARIIRDAGEAK